MLCITGLAHLLILCCLSLISLLLAFCCSPPVGATTATVMAALRVSQNLFDPTVFVFICVFVLFMFLMFTQSMWSLASRL